MNERSKNLLQIRPTILSARIHDQMSFNEHFQNSTLRPIIKLQNTLILATFNTYIKKHKNTFHGLSTENKLLYVEKAVQKDSTFNNTLKGIIIGQFTIEEYLLYTQNSSSLNKRMMHMVIERFKDQIQFFELSTALV